MSENDMEKLFRPSSVAVIGASQKKGKIGHDVLLNLIEYGYKGKIYPINPNDKEIMGLKAYPSVLEIKGDIDLEISLTVDLPICWPTTLPSFSIPK